MTNKKLNQKEFCELTREEQFKADIARKDELIENRDEMLAKKDKMISEKDKEISEKDVMLAKKDEELEILRLQIKQQNSKQ